MSYHSGIRSAFCKVVRSFLIIYIFGKYFGREGFRGQAISIKRASVLILKPIYVNVQSFNND